MLKAFDEFVNEMLRAYGDRKSGVERGLRHLVFNDLRVSDSIWLYTFFSEKRCDKLEYVIKDMYDSKYGKYFKVAYEDDYVITIKIDFVENFISPDIDYNTKAQNVKKFWTTFDANPEEVWAEAKNLK